MPSHRVSAGSTTGSGLATSTQQTCLLKRHVQDSEFEFSPAVKVARTVQYVQQQHQGCDMSANNLAAAASASADSAPTNAEQSVTAGSSRQLSRVAGSLTYEQSLASPRRLAPYPAAPSCSAECSSVGEPETSASSPLDDDEDAAKLMELLQLVQQHRRELEQQPGGLSDAVLGTALTDTDAALNMALSAMSLATTMCDNGSPEAADKALEFAEQALTMTVQRLAKAQLMVLHKVEQQQDQGVALPAPAADIARRLTATVASAGAGSSSSAAQERQDTAAVQDTKEEGIEASSGNAGDN